MKNRRILCCLQRRCLMLALGFGSLLASSPAQAAVTVTSRLTTVSTTGNSSSNLSYSDTQTDTSTAPGVYGPYAALGGFGVTNFSHGEAFQDVTLATAGGGLQVSGLTGTSQSTIDVDFFGSAENSTSNTFELNFTLGESSSFSFSGFLQTQTNATGATTSSTPPTIRASLQNLDTLEYVADVNSPGNFSVNTFSPGFPPPPDPSLLPAGNYQLILSAITDSEIITSIGPATETQNASFSNVELTITPIPEPNILLLLVSIPAALMRRRAAAASKWV